MFLDVGMAVISPINHFFVGRGGQLHRKQILASFTSLKICCLHRKLDIRFCRNKQTFANQLRNFLFKDVPFRTREGLFQQYCQTGSTHHEESST